MARKSLHTLQNEFQEKRTLKDVAFMYGSCVKNQETQVKHWGGGLIVPKKDFGSAAPVPDATSGDVTSPPGIMHVLYPYAVLANDRAETFARCGITSNDLTQNHILVFPQHRLWRPRVGCKNNVQTQVEIKSLTARPDFYQGPRRERYLLTDPQQGDLEWANHGGPAITVAANPDAVNLNSKISSNSQLPLLVVNRRGSSKSQDPLSSTQRSFCSTEAEGCMNNLNSSNSLNSSNNLSKSNDLNSCDNLNSSNSLKSSNNLNSSNLCQEADEDVKGRKRMSAAARRSKGANGNVNVNAQHPPTSSKRRLTLDIPGVLFQFGVPMQQLAEATVLKPPKKRRGNLPSGRTTFPGIAFNKGLRRKTREWDKKTKQWVNKA